MKNLVRLAAITTAALLFNAVGVNGLPTSNAAAPLNSVEATCGPNGRIHQILGFPVGTINTEKDKLPVILVHGIRSNYEHWSRKDIAITAKLSDLEKANVAQNFAYSADDLVLLKNRFDQTAQRLAATIYCAAKLSESRGGPNKVAIVGYSLGAALIHKASTMELFGEKTANNIGQVITVSDPWKNVGVFNFYGSGTLKLEPFPAAFPVRAIAGNIVTRIYSGKTMIDRYSWDSDNFIALGGATSQATNGEGGGVMVAECGSDFYISMKGVVQKRFNGTSCYHDQLLEDKAIQNDIVNYVFKAADRLVKPIPPSSPTNPAGPREYIGGLSFEKSGALIPDSIINNRDGSQFYTFKDTSVASHSSGSKANGEYGTFSVLYSPSWVGNKNPEVISQNSNLKYDPAPFETIGGLKATHYGVWDKTSYHWYFASKGVYIGSRGYYPNGFEQSAAYQSILTMQWK